MKTTVRKYIFAAIFVIILAFLTSCYNRENLLYTNHENTSAGGHMNILENIVVGESTFQDVMQHYAIDSMATTSYGGLCEVVLENGNILQIKFYGKDLIVGSIELQSRD